MDDSDKVSIIRRLQNTRPVFSNYFNQKIEDSAELYYSDESAILRCKYEDYSRLFVLSNSKSDFLKLFQTLPEDRYVLNYPAKSANVQFDALLLECGFEHVKTYKRMSNTNIAEWSDVSKIQYACENDVDDIITLLTVETRFVNYLDYLPNASELNDLIKDKLVLVNRENGIIVGVLIYQIFGKRYYLRAWLDKGSDGSKLLLDVYSLLKSKDARYVYFWVDSENKRVIKMHSIMGANFDGLNDYIFRYN